MNRPKVSVSIIVATFNVELDIEACLDSILDQQDVVIECIVMDGASTDRTVDIIRSKYSQRLAHFYSGPDRGIYDAWNKGIAVANGEWIAFLGADDRFVDSLVVSRLLKANDKASTNLSNKVFEIITSRGLINDPQLGLRQFGEPWSWSQMKRYQKICHPGLLHHRRLFDRVGMFSMGIPIAADYDLLIRSGPETKALFVDVNSVIVGENGISRRNVHQVFSEYFGIQCNSVHIGIFNATCNLIFAEIKLAIKSRFPWLRQLFARKRA